MSGIDCRNLGVRSPFSRTWICSQKGAREHYAVPRTLHAEGRLDRLYTDFWASSPWRAIGRLSGKRGLQSRYHPGLADAWVTSFNLRFLRSRRNGEMNPYARFLEDGEAFGRKVLRAVQSARSRSSVIESRIFFGYDTGFLEPARWIGEMGGKSIVCQMDPSRYEVDLVKAEESRWPGWAREVVEVPEEYFRRREEEWETADLVMVNSEWTRQALVRQGLREEKLVVVPLAFERENPENFGQEALVRDSGFKFPVCGFTHAKPLRVLFLGQVILRKGIQYLVEAARMLVGEPVHFDVVGPIGISSDAMASSPSSMTFHGAISRDRTGGFYRAADLFVLPTLSDGFAITQLEAMSFGLPVITTPNCGEVVSDGHDGVIVPSGDPMALAEALQLILQDPEALREMAHQASLKAACFGLDRLSTNLLALEDRLR